MAQLILTIPDAVAPRVIDAMAAQHGWDPGLGITKTEFVQNILTRYLRESVIDYEGNRGRNEAVARATGEIDIPRGG